jgi:type IV pilus assembly protein PilN
MPRINLLPWREERRKLRQRQFNLTAAMVAAAGALTVVAWYGYEDGQIGYQNQRNQYLADQIKLMDERITKIKDLEDTKQRLLARMQIIEQLQQSRPTEVHFLDQLVKTLPGGVFLTSVVQNGDALNINGSAESSARVSTYLRNLDASPWLGNPNLQVVQKDPARSGAQQFQLTAKIIDKAAQQAKDKADAAAAGGT